MAGDRSGGRSKMEMFLKGSTRFARCLETHQTNLTLLLNYQGQPISRCGVVKKNKNVRSGFLLRFLKFFETLISK